MLQGLRESIGKEGLVVVTGKNQKKILYESRHRANRLIF
jgi:hypothetical protein